MKGLRGRPNLMQGLEGTQEGGSQAEAGRGWVVQCFLKNSVNGSELYPKDNEKSLERLRPEVT